MLIIKIAIVTCWAMVIIVGEIISFSIKKRKLVKGNPTVGLIIRKNYNQINQNPDEISVDMAGDTNFS